MDLTAVPATPHPLVDIPPPAPTTQQVVGTKAVSAAVDTEAASVAVSAAALDMAPDLRLATPAVRIAQVHLPTRAVSTTQRLVAQATRRGLITPRHGTVDPSQATTTMGAVHLDTDPQTWTLPLSTDLRLMTTYLSKLTGRRCLLMKWRQLRNQREVLIRLLLPLRRLLTVL